jgi:hypothetical protein
MFENLTRNLAAAHHRHRGRLYTRLTVSKAVMGRHRTFPTIVPRRMGPCPMAEYQAQGLLAMSAAMDIPSPPEPSRLTRPRPVAGKRADGRR